MLTAEEESSPGGTVLSISTYTYDVFGNQLSADQYTSGSGLTTLTQYAYLDADSQNGNLPQVWADLNSSSSLITVPDQILVIVFPKITV